MTQLSVQYGHIQLASQKMLLQLCSHPNFWADNQLGKSKRNCRIMSGSQVMAVISVIPNRNAPENV